jgi:hypothetical protein
VKNQVEGARETRVGDRTLNKVKIHWCMCEIVIKKSIILYNIKRLECLPIIIVKKYPNVFLTLAILK